MAQVLKYVLFIFICFQFGSIQGEEDCLLMSLEEIQEFSMKNYIQPEHIYFSNDQILVNTSEGLLPVSSLMTDALGIYYSTHKQDSDKWTCPACRNENDRPCRSLCGTCEWPSNYNLDLLSDVGALKNLKTDAAQKRDSDRNRYRDIIPDENGCVPYYEYEDLLYPFHGR